MIDSAGERLGASAARELRKIGRYAFGPGLTDAEFTRIEAEFGIEFADDHRAFLAAGLPLNSAREPGETWLHPWPDWRNGDPEALRTHVDWAVNGVLFDVEHGFWKQAWGDRPDDLAEALATARIHLDQVPKLVPVFAHRFLPSGHGTYGHPVLSIHQTDIIFYGTDLVNYVANEFLNEGHWSIDPGWTPPPLVAFWGDFL
ncbi:hypothetical protein [Actinomadura parmotrematis]|uniref:SMI1/KNR4 family protein n=1 Tax=Actinomadura parmotrematis TaxID=2864039 RepID=A0ABS7FWU0_9ACTN|nr:hypothetical protein [Actinomadura parmotrematis]MBW8484894.1 hypothetical protein [Actinomadura parmotrematis]